jgi:negative regulator of replication initiation
MRPAGLTFGAMKNIEVSDDVYAALQRLANHCQRTPDEVLASLLNAPPGSPEGPEPLAAFAISGEFRSTVTEAEKYLTLLRWVAARHPSEFGEFIRSQCGGGRYLSMSREDVLAACRQNQARQIDGTQYWAVMNIDAATKRRFLARLLEFAGYRVEVIDFVCHVLSGGAPPRRFRAAA